MFVAKKLKEKNIAEYLLYMWQVEDLIRANGCDLDAIRRNIVAAYPESQQVQLEEWYGNLVEMMTTEGVKEKGHLQINKNVVQGLVELHLALISSPQYPFYNAAYFKALPFIVELRQKKQDGAQETEIETCFEALYGILMLKLQHKEITAGTAKAMEAISSFISLLANYWEKEAKGEITPDE